MSERQSALEKALREIEKQFGKGAIMRLGDDAIDIKENVISSGSLTLDAAIGVGGYPKGRIIEIYGPESAGKTTFALHAIASAQKNGAYAAFIDAEHALDPGYAKALGVDVENLILSQPDNGEQALEIAEELIKSAAVELIVIDSVAALVPVAELNGDMGDSHIGLQARLMSQAMRKLSAIINRSNVVVIFINQIREKVGIIFGSPEVTTGGRALKFYATIRLEVRRSEQIKDANANVIGNKTNVKVVKNKVAPPFKVAEVEIIYGEGISYLGEIIDLALKYDIFKRSGSWYSHENVKLGQGKENAKDYLRQHPDFTLEVEEKIKELMLK